MEKLFKIFIIICILTVNVPYIKAYEEKRAIVSASNGLNIRENPSSTSSILTSVPDGSNLTITGEAASGSGCNDIWYQVKLNNLSGYACSTFIYVLEEGTGEISTEFPDDYKVLLEELQKIYPNAIFKPVQATNSIPNTEALGSLEMEFKTAVYNQYYTQNKSLIWDSNGSRDGWKNLASYNYDTNSFRNDYSGGGSTWYSASEEIISYYLDPRNFLNEEYVFMFESLAYDASVHTVEGVEDILSGSYMATEKVDGGSLSFAEVIMEAGIKTNVSPYFLASRIRLEVGSGRSALVKGTYDSYPEFNGYYNYYNIGAGGTNVVYNGLKFAYDSGWNSEYKAIIDGAEWIKSDYVQSGSSTNYTQKWDVFCDGRSTCFNKQYMQNIQAPSTEAYISYKAYKDILGTDMYETPFIFYIPVFKNMNASYPLPSTASPISYLNSLVIDSKLLSNFDGLKFEYDYVVPYNTTSLNIEAVATAKDKGAVVTGLGNIELTDMEQIINITVTAANGNISIYKINVTKLEPGEDLLTLEETISELSGIKITDKNMSGVTSVDVLKAKFNEVNSQALVTIKDKKGNIVSDDLSTGDIVTVTVGEETVTYNYVLFGDNNGDGLIDIVDLLLVQKHLLSVTKLNEEYLKASDVNKDGLIDIVDLLLVQKHLLNVTYIIQ